jgi:hypothetical protein
VLIPATTPDHGDAVVNAAQGPIVPTGNTFGAVSDNDISGGGWTVNPLHTKLLAGKELPLPWLRPSLFATPIKSVELLGKFVNISYTISDAVGMLVQGFSSTPAVPPFDCKQFGCTCKGMGNFYGIGW